MTSATCRPKSRPQCTRQRRWNDRGAWPCRPVACRGGVAAATGGSFAPPVAGRRATVAVSASRGRGAGAARPFVLFLPAPAFRVHPPVRPAGGDERFEERRLGKRIGSPDKYLLV